MLILNPRLVLTQTFNGPDFLVAGEARFHRVVGQEQDHADANNDSDEAHEEEEDLPGLEGFGGVVLEAVGGEGADDSSSTGANVPKANAEWLFWWSQGVFS